MGINFRRFAQAYPTEGLGTGPEGAGAQGQGPALTETPPCPYCGSREVSETKDTGRGHAFTCQACGGTQSTSGDNVPTAELIGDPSNHPRTNPDPDTGGVGGAGNLPTTPKVVYDRPGEHRPGSWEAALHTAVENVSVERVYHNGIDCPVCNRPEGLHLRRMASDLPVHGNPVTGEDHWFHGTNYHPEKTLDPKGFDPKRPGGTIMPPKHEPLSEDHVEASWNTDLGTHFSTLHEVANHGFAQPDSKMNKAARVAYTKLHMANPIHFGDESEMNSHVINWAHENGHHFLPKKQPEHSKFVQGDYDGIKHKDGTDYSYLYDHHSAMPDSDRKAMSAIDKRGVGHIDNHPDVSDKNKLRYKEQWLEKHPKRAEISAGYTQHLKDQGHDGVIYGNLHEGPKRHTCAIAFHDTPVTIHKWEWTHDEGHKVVKGLPGVDRGEAVTPKPNSPHFYTSTLDSALAASLHSSSMAEVELIDDLKMHFCATWHDVRNKARDITRTGGVHIAVANGEGLGGTVQGEHNVYQTLLTYVPGTKKVAYWQCGCKWASYAWGRSPAYKRFEGRMCFTPGMQVSMADGTHKPIEQVGPGDRVLTHDGVGTVRNRWENHYHGEIVGITRAGSSRTVWATVDHGMLANTSMRGLTGGSSTKAYRERKAVQNKDAWARTEAGQLQAGDWLMGTYSEAVQEAPSVSLSELHEHVVTREGRGRLETLTARSARVYAGASLPEFAYTDPFAVLLGYYLAEGNVEHLNVHGIPRIVQWTFGLPDEEYVQEVIEALDALGAGTARVHRNGNRILVKVSNATLALLLSRLTGTHAATKTLHPDLMQAPLDFQETLLRTYLNGDGCESRAGTASIELARQFVTIGCRVGHYVPREHTVMNNRGPNNRTPGNPIYYVETAGRYMQGRERLWENFYGSRVTGIERQHYYGMVYNLNVDEQHTYAVEDTVVFNCSHALAMQFEAQRQHGFGRKPHADVHDTRPEWMRSDTPVVVHHQRATDRAPAIDHTRFGALQDDVYPADHGLDLERTPLHAVAAVMVSQGAGPVAILDTLMSFGAAHEPAQRVVKHAVEHPELLPTDGTSDAREHAEEFGVGVPEANGDLTECDQCGGKGCGHCGGAGQVKGGQTTIPDQNADAGVYSRGLESAASLFEADYASNDAFPYSAPEVRNPGTSPEHSNSKNPGSTGWATAQDPQGWSDAWDHRDDMGGQHFSAKEPKAPSVGGVALKAHDTGRVLMLQRSHEDEKDPARGKWEFPGGHYEDGDKTGLHGAIREWEEEVGHPFPAGGHVHHTWTSGPYQGHLVVIPSEKAVNLSAPRTVENPDDDSEQRAWINPQHAKKYPDLRDEVKANTPWHKIEKATIDKAAVVNVWGNPYNSKMATSYYHVAPMEFRDSIAEHGLDHGRGESVYQGKDFPGGNYMFRNEDHAHQYRDVRNQEELDEYGPHEAREHDVWHVSGDHEVHRDPFHDDESGLGESSVYSRHPIGPDHLRLHSELHDEPEPALPVTTAEDDEDDFGPGNGDGVEDEGNWGPPRDAKGHHPVGGNGASSYGERYRSAMEPGVGQEAIGGQPNSVHASQGSVEDIVARFQATAGARALGGATGGSGASSGPSSREGGISDSDIAAAARKVALKAFSPSEQNELINEGRTGNVRARNFGDLQIEGTHYSDITEDSEELVL